MSSVIVTILFAFTAQHLGKELVASNQASLLPERRLRAVCDETLSGINGEGYRGCQTFTRSNITCQKWTGQSPHTHSRTPRNYPDKGLGDHNYCRNPDGESTIWCYTTYPSVRWDSCDPLQALRCSWSPVITGSIAGHDLANLGIGFTMTSCKDACDNHPLCQSVDFRTSDGTCSLGDCQIDDGVCTNDNDAAHEYSSCLEAMCDESLSGINGEGYRGCQAFTRSGSTCQKWTSQSPHTHDRTPTNYPDNGLGDHSYCRNPDGESTIWCYTTDPSVRWEYCDPVQVPCAVTSDCPPGYVCFGNLCQAADCSVTDGTNVSSAYPCTCGSGTCTTDQVCTSATSHCHAPCDAAAIPVSVNRHTLPIAGSPLSKLAFSSCYDPSTVSDSHYWYHVRHVFGSELWLWLGDNAYSDGIDMTYKRQQYNEARNQEHYTTVGPIGAPPIPVLGTWDDHDFAVNNYGSNYQCSKESQAEFVHHFNVPPSDPRHPDHGPSQQKGIYSATMFSKPSNLDNSSGVHLIMLDARSGRDPTFSTYGACRGAESKMLTAAQWDWLTSELNKTSHIKVIGSGIQVLPPTDQTRALTEYCSYDGPSGTFMNAILSVDEAGSEGTWYESWAEIPQERTRLLRLAQKSINAGNAKQIIFVSGDQH